MPLKAVAFDVDGTLYPNASMYLRSWGLALGNMHLIRTLEQVRWQLRDQPDAGDDFHRVQSRLMAQRLNITPERAYALVEGRIYTRWYRIFRKLRPFPQLADTLQAFKAAGLKLAVLSDFPIRNRLVDLGLAGPWDVAFSSEETGYLKPHPEPFRVLAQRLGLAPAEVLYVGNSYRYDVLGADSVGMPCAHLTKKPKNGSQAVFSFSRYFQLKDFVFRCLGDPEYNSVSGRVSI